MATPILPTHHRFIDLTGQRFGRLLVVEYAGKSRCGKPLWLCRCDCGAELPAVIGASLRRGNTKSCRCLHRDRVSEIKRTHSRSKTREYRIWACIISRCTNPKNITYHKYGGRGIGICERWRTDFMAFYEDLGDRPTPDASVDRIDNDQGYNCGKCEDCCSRGVGPNCRWATRKEQCRNKRTNVLLTWRGETLSMIEWEERTGIPGPTIRDRLKAGWGPDDAFTRPVRGGGKRAVRSMLTEEAQAAVREIAARFRRERRALVESVGYYNAARMMREAYRLSLED